MSDLKECYLVEVVDYSVLNKIDHDPDFKWWEKHVPQRRDRIISKAKQLISKKYVKRKKKFWIEFPKKVQEDMALDKKN